MHKLVVYYLQDDKPYAWSDDKTICKKFECTRDMRIFDKEIYTGKRAKIMKKLYPLAQLVIYTLSTYDYQNERNCSLEEAITLDEEAAILQVHDFYESSSALYTFRWVDPKIFKDKIYNALDIFGYTDRFSEISEAIYYSENIDMTLSPDQLSIFVERYGYTLKD